MMRRNRKINIFSMSALDLFASAMGSFIIIAIVLFPYYLKYKDLSKEINLLSSQLGNCEVKNGDLRSKIENLDAKNALIQQGLASCQQKLQSTFLAVVMKWENRLDDVDLYVIDPRGNRYYFDKHNRSSQHYPGSKARLSVDTIRGPGVEIWDYPKAMPGLYSIEYHFFKDAAVHKPVLVKANLYSRDGVIKLPDITLRRQGARRHVVKFYVSNSGQVSVR